MDTKNKDFLQALNEAEMILIGIGEEFNQVKKLRENENYSEVRKKIEGTSEAWLIPAMNKLYDSDTETLQVSLQKFADMIAEKNYFVVSVSTNDVVEKVNWREKRFVMPCGGSYRKQCIGKCEKGLLEVTQKDWVQLEKYKDILVESDWQPEKYTPDLGICPQCGKPLILNNIYAGEYDENGYLDSWQIYTKWLQGTLNRKLMVLELGVGMQFPSVIRWPFEKVAFFNQKASFWRVNESLYHLSEELKEKGNSISQNAIDWLQNLC